MQIYGLEKGLGAKYEAKRIEDNEVVYGLATIEVDDEKSYLIRLFETDDFTDGVPALAHYVAVWTNSVTEIEDEEAYAKAYWAEVEAEMESRMYDDLDDEY